MEKYIKRTDWRSDFVLVGTPKIRDYSYKIDAFSDKSKWQYNVLNLDVDCGEKYGIIRAELMGGFSSDPNRSNTIYAHGQKPDGSDDYSSSMQIGWDERFDPDILSQVGERSFITIGLERTVKGELFKKHFLSAYDAIAYVHEHLTEDMLIKVNGHMKYSIYNDKVQVKKEIESIELVDTDKPVEKVSRFTQTILLDKYSADLKNVDNAKGVMYITARVLDYVKEMNGVSIKGQYPYYMNFEYPLDLSDQEQCKLIYDTLFKVNKDITQITFNGNFVESGATVVPTWDDVPEQIKQLVKAKVFTKEEAIQRCSTNGGKEKRMVLGKPHVKLVGEETIPTLQMFPGKYTEEELDFSFVNNAADDNGMPFDADDNVDASTNAVLNDVVGMDWLN